MSTSEYNAGSNPVMGLTSHSRGEYYTVNSFLTDTLVCKMDTSVRRTAVGPLRHFLVILLYLTLLKPGTSLRRTVDICPDGVCLRQS